MQNGLAPWILVLFVGGVLGFGWYHQRLRRLALREMAGRLGLTEWPDDSLPRGLSFIGTSFVDWSKLSNEFEGVINGQQVVILDLSKSQGRSRRTKTIVAVRTKQEPLRSRLFDVDSQRAGDWVLYFRHGSSFGTSGLMQVEDAELLIREITDLEDS